MFSATFRISISVNVFFFRADDGIRDYMVTGVQTCALPISIHYCTPSAHRLPESPGEFVQFIRPNMGWNLIHHDDRFPAPVRSFLREDNSAERLLFHG